MNNSAFLKFFVLFCIIMAQGTTTLRAQDDYITPQIRRPIGVILPLSGKWKPVGQKILKGIELASGVFSAGDTPPVEYIIRDYASDDTKIPGIIEELDRQHDVLAIIGPIGGPAGEITCKQTQKRGIPTIIFTQSGLAPVNGSWCFGNFLTIYTQNRSLLQAARALNITRFAICYPTDQFGETFTRSFEQLAPQYGVQIVKKQPYEPQRTDFKDVVKGLKGAPVEALLIPDSPVNAAMIASYVSFFNMKNVRLFGPSLWDNSDLAKQGGRAVQGAIFVSGFYPGSSEDVVQEFNQAFHANFASTPTIWEASAYDTANILQQILRANINSRAAMRAAITSLSNYMGVTGRTSFKSDGTTRKDVYTLIINGSGVSAFNP